MAAGAVMGTVNTAALEEEVAVVMMVLVEVEVIRVVAALQVQMEVQAVPGPIMMEKTRVIKEATMMGLARLISPTLAVAIPLPRRSDSSSKRPMVL